MTFWRKNFRVGVAALGFLLTGPMAFAQQESAEAALSAMASRLQRVERHLDLLRGQLPGSAADVGGAVGATGPAAVRVQIRLSELEAELRRLTGKIEELGHAVAVANGRLEKLAADVEFRLTALERGAGAAPAADGDGPARGVAIPSGPGIAVTGLPEDSGGPGLLGTISPDDLLSSGAAAPGQAAAEVQPGEPGSAVAQSVVSTPRASVLPEGTPKERYDAAFALLRKGDYVAAERAFQEYVAVHAADPLAGNAQYWLGETFYVRGDFDKAAATFLGVMRDFPDSAKAPDSMLKLGMSLARIGQAEEACTTLDALLAGFPNAAKTTRRRAENERRKANCG